jgi:predicted DNA-binding transcriptional regulator YafY
MLQLLKVRDQLSIAELARKLEVSERQIRQYKQDLEEAGIYISARRGPDGGYALAGEALLPPLSLTATERRAAEHLKSVVHGDSSFLYREDALIALDKLTGGRGGEPNALFGVEKVSVDHEKEQRYYQKLEEAIIARQKVNMTYYALSKDEARRRIIHPYHLLKSEGAYYVVGYCELRKELRIFKLIRIENLYLSAERFTRDSKIDLNTFLNQNLGVMHEQKLRLVMEARFPTSKLLSETIFTPDQVITPLDEQRVRYEGTFDSETEIKSWLLSLGASVRVIEPRSLVETVAIELDRMMDHYRGDD